MVLEQLGAQITQALSKLNKSTIIDEESKELVNTVCLPVCVRVS